MSLDHKDLETIDEAILQALIAARVSEGKAIEYKIALPGNADSEKKEFLADVSSFANTQGGVLILGMKEDAGIPIELIGIPAPDPDAVVARLENLIRDGVSPRLTGVAIRAVPLKDSRHALVIRIPRSWAPPHMVVYKGSSRFYARNSTGKHPLDISELRALFALSETTAERIKGLRLERLARILSDETPIPLLRNPRIVLHIVPITALQVGMAHDLRFLANEPALIQPMYSDGGWNHRLNFDGFLSYQNFGDSTSAHTYLQVFRNGVIEAVEAFLMREQDGRRIIFSGSFEEMLVEALPRYLNILRRLGVEPPLLVMLSLLGVKGFVMFVDPRRHFYRQEQIDRDDLMPAEILLDTYESEPATILRPAFDAVWNAAGFSGSLHYDAAGKWSPPR